MIEKKAISNMLDAVNNAAESYLIQHEITNQKLYDDFIKYLMKVAMKYNKGHMNPEMVQWVVKTEYQYV